jgi:hypothetical protein
MQGDPDAIDILPYVPMADPKTGRPVASPPGPSSSPTPKDCTRDGCSHEEAEKLR